jgi:hypothetical protein
VGERLIDVIARIVTTGVVTDPGLSVVHVRGVRVAGLVNIIALGLCGIIGPGGSGRHGCVMGRLLSLTHGRGAARRDWRMSPTVLREGWDGKKKQS